MGHFKNPYADESEMVTALAHAAKSAGWLAYPETSGFDLLLVATDKVQAAGIRAGDQLGVEGKRAGNLRLLVQAMPKTRSDSGPNFHVALVPRATSDFKDLAKELGILVIEACVRKWNNAYTREWVKSDFTGALSFFPPLYRQYYEKPLWSPEVEVWTPPGVKSPKSVSPWKVKAVKLCLLAEQKGFLTSADFRDAKVSMTLWRKRWIEATDKRAGRFTKYRLRTDYPHDPPPHLKYPEIAEALRADEKDYGSEAEAQIKRRRRKRAA